MISVGILTVSDDVAKGAQDNTAKALRQELGPDYHVVAYDIVPKEASQIRRVLRLWSERDTLDVIITLGGIHLDIKDHVPDITNELIEHRLDALAQVVALAKYQKFPQDVSSRGVIGVKGKSLIINMANNSDVACYTLKVVAASIPNIVEQLRVKPSLS